MMRAAGFVHLHNHTEYSLLDGASRIKPLAEAAAGYDFPALAITDHGNMFGAIEFYKAAQSAGVKPIIGCECYVAPRNRQERTLHPEIPESAFHLTLLCESREGYHNLIKLCSAAYLEGFYYRPRIDKELLAQYARGLIALSACLKGEVNYYLAHNDYDKARNAAQELQAIMGKDNFYLEVMRLGLPECARIEPGIEQLSRELGIPVVATNDVHYIRREDADAHDALICLGTGKKIKDRARLRFETQEVYLKSPAEMAQLFKDRPEWLANTLTIAQRCNLLLETKGSSFQLPVFPRPDDFPSDFAYLKKLAHDGLEERFKAHSNQQPDPAQRPQYQERLARELEVIHKTGFAGYFLIVRDIINYARSQGIAVGPGRGSAVGSLVLYALGITEIDPIRYGLLFERFLTTERVTLPDIDIDFADNRRHEVIDYIRKRYGQDCVAQIITFGTMQSRASIRDIGRVLDIPLFEVDRLAKMINEKETLAAAYRRSNELRTLLQSRPEYQQLFRIAQQVEGIARHASIHASGVVISPQSLDRLVPLYRTNDGGICTQYDMNALEAIGLLKMDVLGLRTLTVIDLTRNLLKPRGIQFDETQVPLDDPPTYDLLRRAEVAGVFQLESSGMQNLLLRTQPENLEDLMAVISLYRPGPMGNIDVDAYVERKKGKAATKLLHPALAEILKDTYGVIIYQEQVMRIANSIAGFSLAEADRLRRVMGKKIAEEMGPMREKFLAGAKKQHISAKTANAIFDLIEPFAGYGFNKSHAAGYGMLSYLTAYLKANYPVEFMTANLTSEIGDAERLRKLISEVRRMGLVLLPPDINASDYPFTIEEVVAADGSRSTAIRFGLGGIKNLGQGVCAAIVEARRERPYNSFTDFIRRTRQFTNRKAYEALIMAGALDSLEKDRQQLLERLPAELEKATSIRAAMRDRQIPLFGQNDQERIDCPIDNGNLAPTTVSQSTASGRSRKEALEKAAFGFYLSHHPLEEFACELAALQCPPLENLNNLGEQASASAIAIAGIITSRRFRPDKTGKDYALLRIEDLTGSAEVVVFNRVLETCSQYLKPDEPVLIQGRLNVRGEGKASIRAESIFPLAHARNFLSHIFIKVRSPAIEESELLQIRSLLEQHPGNAQICFLVPNPDSAGSTIRIRVNDLKVQPSTALKNALEALPAIQAVRITGKLPAAQPAFR